MRGELDWREANGVDYASDDFMCEVEAVIGQDTGNLAAVGSCVTPSSGLDTGAAAAPAGEHAALMTALT